MGPRPNRQATARWSIKREIDLIAVIALLLSLVAIASQAIAWIRGPQVRLVTPDRIALYRDQAPGKAPIVRVAASISYANFSSQSQGALVTSEAVELRIGHLVSRQEWNAFGTIVRTGDAIEVRFTGLALPVPLPGQASLSHLTLFTPLRRRCGRNDPECNPEGDYISPDQFIAAASTNPVATATFRIRLADGTILETACEVPLGPEKKAAVASLQTGVFYGVCYPREG